MFFCKYLIICRLETINNEINNENFSKQVFGNRLSTKQMLLRYFTMHTFIETRINNILIKRFTGEIMLEM